MPMTEEEEIRIEKLEGQVDVLTRRLDDLINGIVDTIKNHPIMKHRPAETFGTRNEMKNELESISGIGCKTEQKNTEKISNDIIRYVRENMGVFPNDSSKDDEINRMSLNEIFKRWCEWNGYINLSGEFKRVIGSIYGIDIEGRLILK